MFGRSILPRNVQEGLAQVGAPGSKTIEVPTAYTPALKAAAVRRLEEASAAGKFSRSHYWDPRSGVGSPIAFVSVFTPQEKEAKLTPVAQGMASVPAGKLLGGDHTDFTFATGLPPMIAWMFEPIFRGLPHDEAMAWAVEFFRDHLPDNVQIAQSALWSELASKILQDEQFGMLRFITDGAHAELVTTVATKLAAGCEDAAELLAAIRRPAPKGSAVWHASSATEAAISAAEVVIERTRHLAKKDHPSFATLCMASSMMSGMAMAQTLRSAAEAAARDAAAKVADGIDSRVAAEEARAAMHRQQVQWLRAAIESTRVVNPKDMRNPLAMASSLFGRVPRIGQGAKPGSVKPAEVRNPGPWSPTR